MDRHWLLTWNTYGTWLPGDRRGSHLRVPDGGGRRTFAYVPGDTRGAPRLRAHAKRLMRGPPVRLTVAQARTAADAMVEQASHREWSLPALAVMANHVHIVVGVPGNPEPARLLHAFKAYTSRALNREFGRPRSGTWWVQSGSTRLLGEEANVLAATRYVRDQAYPLVVRIDGRTWDGAI